MFTLTVLGPKEAEMRIIGVDLHTRQQTIAMLDPETGALVEKTLEHEGETVREFYSALLRGIAKTVRFLIPKPKDEHAKFLPIGSDAELEQQVKQEFDNLFRNFGAQINSNGRLRIMDFATVTFDVGNLRVRASRDRGTVGVSVAPIHAVREWHGLGFALRSLQENDGIAEPIPSSILRGAGKLLDRDFVKLSEAFSEDKYPTARKRIRDISESLRQKWMEDFNQKSKVYHATTP